MKRLSTIVFLCGMVFVANVFAMSEEDKEFYRDFVSNAGVGVSEAGGYCGITDTGAQEKRSMRVPQCMEASGTEARSTPGGMPGAAEKVALAEPTASFVCKYRSIGMRNRTNPGSV